MSIKVVVSWAAWAWKSSIIARVVEKLWYETHDLGQVFRARAIAKGMTINEYDKHIEETPSEDIEMDNDFKNILQNNGKDTIVSWRMWFHFLPEALSIRLDVEPEEWARRVFLQDRGNQEKKYNNIAEAMEANQDRMARLQKRMIDVYGVDFMDKSHYKKIIKTDGKNVEQTSQEIIEAIEDYKKTL